MKEFLKKYLTEDQLKEVEAKYLADHPDAKGLPMHISKARLDEVLGQKKTAEEANAASMKALDDYKLSVEGQIAEAVKKAQDDATKHETDALNAVKADFAATEAIYKAHGRNVTAIKALMDTSKKVDDEIKRIQKSDPYLFEDDIPGGTGKSGADGDNSEDKELAKMRAAVGI